VKHKTQKKLAIAIGTILLSLALATAPSSQNHPFSEIFPPDQDLGFGGKNIENVSQLEAASIRPEASDLSFRDSGNLDTFIWDSSNRAWRFKNSDLDLDKNNIENVSNASIDQNLELKGESGTISLDAIDTGFGDYLNIRSQDEKFTISQIEAPKGEEEATLALMRGEDSGNPEFLDLYNIDYGDPTFGIRVQSRGGGSLRPFRFQYNDGSGVYDVLNMFPSGNVDVANGDLTVKNGDIKVSSGSLKVKKSNIFAFGGSGDNLVLRGGNSNPSIEIQVKNSSGNVVFWSPENSQSVFEVNSGGDIKVPNGDIDTNGNNLTSSGGEICVGQYC